jgi:hypothetical protein
VILGWMSIRVGGGLENLTLSDLVRMYVQRSRELLYSAWEIFRRVKIRPLQPKFIAFDRKTKVCKISKVCAIIQR